MTSVEEEVAEATRPLEPNLADEHVVRKARFNVKNQRDCGAASAVGAATVAIGLLIGNGNVALDAFAVLLGAQAVLIGAAQFFNLLATRSLSRDPPFRLYLAGVITTTVITAVGIVVASELKRHESNVGSSSWWLLLSLAGIGGVLGLTVRRSAESLLDELDDESWRQRVAPLVDKQERAITDVLIELRMQALQKQQQGQGSP